MEFPNLVKVISTDTLRPNLQYAWIANGFIYATNAHIAIKFPLTSLLDKTEIEEGKATLLEGKAFDLEALTFLAKDYKSRVVTETGIICYPKTGKSKFVRYSASTLPDKHPNLYYIADDREEIHENCESISVVNADAVIPTNIEKTPIHAVHFDLTLATNLQKSFIGKADSIILLPTGGDGDASGGYGRAFRVVPRYEDQLDYNQIGIIMPLSIHGFVGGVDTIINNVNQ